MKKQKSNGQRVSYVKNTTTKEKIVAMETIFFNVAHTSSFLRKFSAEKNLISVCTKRRLLTHEETIDQRSTCQFCNKYYKQA